MKPCKRCGTPFKPEWLDAINKMSSCCATCQVRNLHDGLGLPTPPSLLDKHTLRPTLTREEYYRKLKPKRKKQK